MSDHLSLRLAAYVILWWSGMPRQEQLNMYVVHICHILAYGMLSWRLMFCFVVFTFNTRTPRLIKQLCGTGVHWPAQSNNLVI